MALPICDCGVRLKDYRSKNCRSCAKKGKKNPMFEIWSSDHPNWRGGYIQKNGYRLVRRYGEEVYEHRWIMEQHLGRKLNSNEIVHHLNGNKTDNRVENLVVWNQAEHVAHHKPMLGKKSKVKRDPITQRFTK